MTMTVSAVISATATTPPMIPAVLSLSAHVEATLSGHVEATLSGRVEATLSGHVEATLSASQTSDASVGKRQQ